jgi:hypothetical protein
LSGAQKKGSHLKWSSRLPPLWWGKRTPVASSQYFMKKQIKAQGTTYRMANVFLKLTIPSVRKNMEEMKNLCIPGRNAKWHSHSSGSHCACWASTYYWNYTARPFDFET